MQDWDLRFWTEQTAILVADGDDMTQAAHAMGLEGGFVLDSQDDEVALANDMVSKAEAASNFLKALSHEGRLMILCHLSTGEKTVTELENLLSSRQAAVSQQLARLRLEGLVAHRREGKAIYYSLADDRARRMIALVYDMFCNAP
jgi:ArsR family transcriptional regulator